MAGEICIIDTRRRRRRRKRVAGASVVDSAGALLDRLQVREADAVWVAVDDESLRGLVKAIARFPRRPPKRTLFSLARPSLQEHVALGAWFSPILPGAAARVSVEQLGAVLREERPQDYCVAVDRDPATRTLTFWRGDFSRLVVPLSFFPKRGGTVPDPGDVAVLDHGQTIRLGRYETSFDAILYLRDAEYRRRARRRLRERDGSLGGSLRRLRKQKGLRQSDFPKVTARTIARIENGETPSPHAATLRRIAAALGVAVEELGEF